MRGRIGILEEIVPDDPQGMESVDKRDAQHFSALERRPSGKIIIAVNQQVFQLVLFLELQEAFNVFGHVRKQLIPRHERYRSGFQPDDTGILADFGDMCGFE